jgi:lipopolysaccharide/colanic/teichoic acid biosynthesis glycosyltransferase
VQATVVTPADALSHVKRGWRFPWFKRAFDILLSLAGILATVPLWILIIVAIKLDSPGPIFFIQERAGINGRSFKLFKFRSMVADAESQLAEVRHLNQADGPLFKIRDDPRITRVGAVLRRTSLDELPQLVNVVLGKMALVGPRPALPEEVAQYRPQDWERLSVMPGLTCLWVIRGRSDCDFDHWMDYDREYVRTASFWLDLVILVRTLMVVVSGRGAY